MTHIEVIGNVKITNGEIHIIGENRFLERLIQHLLSYLTGRQGRSSTGTRYTSLFCNTLNCRLGEDLVSHTQRDMVGMVTPIGAGLGTEPDTISGTVTDGSGTGIWRVKYIFTFNAGSLPAVTVGEMGLYGDMYLNNTFKWLRSCGTLPGCTEGEILASRLSVADGDFGSFIIDDTAPLVIEWTIEFSFV